MNLQARVEFLERKLTEADQRIAAAEQQRDELQKQFGEFYNRFNDTEDEVRTLKAESQRLREALELAKGAISAFLMAWDGESGAEKAINGMCAIGQIHGVPYGGPSLVSELQGLRSLLAGSVPQEQEP